MLTRYYLAYEGHDGKTVEVELSKANQHNLANSQIEAAHLVRDLKQAGTVVLQWRIETEAAEPATAT